MGIFSKLFNKSNEEDSAVYVCAVIAAAGSSSRMELGSYSKQLLEVGGIPIIAHTLMAYENAETISDIIVVTRQEDIMLIGDIAKEFNITKLRKVITGGATRSASVKNGLAEVPPHTKYVAIADGARPCVRPSAIDEVVNTAIKYGGAALCAPIKDTLKKVDLQGKIMATVDRERVVAVQTPQVFDLVKFTAALSAHGDDDYTDDCQYFENAGFDVYMVKGDADNIKVTYKEDLPLLEGILEARSKDV